MNEEEKEKLRQEFKKEYYESFRKGLEIDGRLFLNLDNSPLKEFVVLSGTEYQELKSAKQELEVLKKIIRKAVKTD